MADHTGNVLLSAIRSLEQVVMPAIDDTRNPLARDQAALIASHLRFLRERNDLRYDKSRFELTHYVRVARSVLDVLEQRSFDDDALRSATQEGARLLDVPGAPPLELERAASALRGPLSRLARSSHTTDEAVGLAIETALLDSADELLGFQRAWFLPQGWDPDEASVVPLESLLADLPTHSTAQGNHP